MPAPATFPPPSIDAASENVEEVGGTLNLVQDHEGLPMEVKIAMCVQKTAAVEWVLQVEINTPWSDVRNASGKCGLAYLPRPEEHDRREHGQVPFD